MVYFLFDESPIQEKTYMIRPNYPVLPLNSTEGSYNVLGARVLNLSYADYLRLCRDVYGAELIGKGHKYVVPYFKDKRKAQPLIDELNKRTKFLLNIRKKEVINND